MSEAITLTPEQLKDLVTSAVTAAVKPNKLEQRQIDEAEAADRRRNEMMASLAKMEDERERAKKNSCSHSRWPANAGRNAGYAAPRGQGEWCTSGQADQNGTAVVICQRCCTTWRFRPSPADYSLILQNGLLGAPPPPPELCIPD